MTTLVNRSLKDSLLWSASVCMSPVPPLFFFNDLSGQSQDGLQFFQSQWAVWMIIFFSSGLGCSCLLTSGVLISLAGSGMSGKNSTLSPLCLPHNPFVLMCAGGLGIGRHVSRQTALCVMIAVAWWWPEDPWPSTSSSTWAHHTSSEGKGSGIGSRQADTVGGGVWHHSAIVTAASAATAGHPGFLFEVQSEVASQPRLLYLSLHLRKRRRRQMER